MCLCVSNSFSASVEVSKQHVMASIIQSSMFPAAQKPDPNLPSKIETEYWPCPPSLATMGNTHTHAARTRANVIGEVLVVCGLISPVVATEIEWRRKKEEEEEGKDEFEDLTDDAKTLQEQELHKVTHPTETVFVMFVMLYKCFHNAISAMYNAL